MLFLPFLALAPLALAVPHKRAITPIYDGSAVNGQTYDYVIAGGGLAGSVLASRLTEDSSRRVLVIESGYDEEGRAEVTDASMYQSTFNTFLDWAYQTVPQTSANNQRTTVRSGRALGGSTTINGMAWSKPHSFQIDAMEGLGNAGLNWNSLQTYMRRAENFQAPSGAQAAGGITYYGSCHAQGGPIGVQYDPNSTPSDLERKFNTTLNNFGSPYANDLACGNPAGHAPIANTRSGNLRTDAYRGYLYGKTRPNLTILAGANVGKVLLSSGSPRATGLEFRDEKGQTYAVNARLEVIMATGSIKTPIILQQSGIGPSSFLSAAGVAQRVDLPIGQNLIDQTTTTTNWRFTGARGGGQPIVFPRFQDLVDGNDATTMRNMLQNDLGKYAQAAVDAGAAPSASALQRVLEIQRDWILNKGAGISENFDYSYGTGNDATFGYDSWFLLPFGRGSVRINNNQPYGGNFSIDPRFYSNAFDRLAQGATARFTRKASSSSPANQQITNELTPGGAVPNGASLEQWAQWSQTNYRSNWHPIGTVAMMSKDLGGSVDTRYRVYGVSGLRVVDGSTLPFQVSSHLMSVLYGLAERAAEFIKADNSGVSPSSSVRPSSISRSASGSSSASRTSSASSTSPPVSTGRAIHPNGDNSKCVEARGGNTADGTQVIITDCNGSSAQQWTIARGSTTVKLAGSNKCLDTGVPGNGVRMKIWTCYANLAAQKWYFTDDNYIAVEGGNQCLDLTDGSKANGNVLQTWQCSANNINQKWTV